VIRVAAVGDIHVDRDLAGRLRASLSRIGDEADVLLLAGDLTRHGTPDEARVVAEEVRGLPVPVVAVLGNHDHHSDAGEDVARILVDDAGVHVLEGTSVTLELPGGRLGVAGVKGFGGGFLGRSGSEFGEPEMKAFARHGRETADRLGEALRSVDAPTVVALTHYSPVDDTLVGEPQEIWAFLGNYLLAEHIDAAGAALAVHGHAHAGREKGLTAGGVRVRNVAQPVLRRPYGVYCLAAADDSGAVGVTDAAALARAPAAAGPHH